MNAASAASSLLSAVWGSRGFPVDPAWIAGQLGIRVMETTLPREVSGALIKEQNEDPQIVLSQSDSTNRKRFTCAHELGHYVSRLERGEESYSFVDLRSQLASSGIDSEEVFANQFAAALLMPEEAVKEQATRTRSVIGLAAAFGVSPEAMSIRLKKLGLKDALSQ